MIPRSITFLFGSLWFIIDGRTGCGRSQCCTEYITESFKLVGHFTSKTIEHCLSFAHAHSYTSIILCFDCLYIISPALFLLLLCVHTRTALLYTTVYSCTYVEMLPVWNRPVSQGEGSTTTQDTTTIRRPVKLPSIPIGYEQPHRHPFNCRCHQCGDNAFGSHEKRYLKGPSNESPVSNGTAYKVATIVTVGLSSGVEKTTLYSTRPLEPYLNKTTCVQCETCHQIIDSDKLSIHKQSCTVTLTPCHVTLPSSCDLLRVNKTSQPTKVENRKLETKPRPNKVAILRALSSEQLMQRYFDKCYSQFEQSLIRCRKCGRTFAPETHARHEPKCRNRN